MQKPIMPPPFISPWQHGLAVLALMALAVWARLPIITLDLNSLLSSFLVDDAFYYYKIAANVFNLHRITYDGDGLSNGFHPLWLALITPFYTAADGGAAFVVRVQWLMLVLNLLTVPALYLAAWRLGAGWLCAAVVTAVFCVHSTFIDMQLNGLETSLNTLVFLLFFHAFITVWLRPSVHWRRYLFLGVMAGATFLARTDNAIALMVAFAALAWHFWPQRMSLWPRLLCAGMVVVAMALPWLLWNKLNFDSFVQSSGKVESIFWGEPQFSWQRVAYNLLLSPLRVYEHLQDFCRLIVSPQGNRAWWAAAVLPLWILSFGWLCRASRPAAVRAGAFFALAVVAVFVANAGFRGFVRIWYHIPVALAFLLTIAAWVAAVRPSLRGSRVASGVLLLWLVSVLWLFSPAKLSGVVAEKSPHLIVAEWINGHTASDAVVGSMNSGVLGYLVQRKVINLDGVVDIRSMRAHWARRREAYADERGIDYLVDNAGALALFCGDNRYYRCETVFTFGDSRNPSYVVQLVRPGVLHQD